MYVCSNHLVPTQPILLLKKKHLSSDDDDHHHTIHRIPFLSTILAQLCCCCKQDSAILDDEMVDLKYPTDFIDSPHSKLLGPSSFPLTDDLLFENEYRDAVNNGLGSLSFAGHFDENHLLCHSTERYE